MSVADSLRTSSQSLIRRLHFQHASSSHDCNRAAAVGWYKSRNSANSAPSKSTTTTTTTNLHSARHARAPNDAAHQRAVGAILAPPAVPLHEALGDLSSVAQHRRRLGWFGTIESRGSRSWCGAYPRVRGLLEAPRAPSRALYEILLAGLERRRGHVRQVQPGARIGHGPVLDRTLAEVIEHHHVAAARAECRRSGASTRRSSGSTRQGSIGTGGVTDEAALGRQRNEDGARRQPNRERVLRVPGQQQRRGVRVGSHECRAYGGRRRALVRTVTPAGTSNANQPMCFEPAMTSFLEVTVREPAETVQVAVSLRGPLLASAHTYASYQPASSAAIECSKALPLRRPSSLPSLSCHTRAIERLRARACVRACVRGRAGERMSLPLCRSMLIIPSCCCTLLWCSSAINQSTNQWIVLLSSIGVIDTIS